MRDLFAEINNLISNNEIVVFMKGTADMPQCGFSATVSHILKQLDVDFMAINVLADQEMRQAIKDFSDWPTIPQIYIKGDFIGGCDIAKEMFQSGELASLLKK